jgi:hypothetical protein
MCPWQSALAAAPLCGCQADFSGASLRVQSDAVVADVRAIIADQLGKDLEEVRAYHMPLCPQAMVASGAWAQSVGAVRGLQSCAQAQAARTHRCERHQ